MTGSEKRLDGWKSIAGFFGRDRTTVARWARERNLPIHHIPGGKQKSVFAYEHELVAWATRNAGITGEPDLEHVAAATTSTDRAPRRWGMLWIIAFALIIPFGLVASHKLPGLRSGTPVSSQVMADYVSARDVWARRTPEDIKLSIELYEKIIRQAPDFALARAGLAEAWLIYREYGDVSDARAFSVARIAAQKALSLDPNLPAAHRALGFIDYWWDNDPVSAGKAFKRALALDERDGQTHFWFANILADVGESDAAEKHYAQARLHAPGSQPIAVEHACAQWQAGRDDLALRLMLDLKTRYPADATISNCLAWAYIGKGDIRNFAEDFGNMARIRNEPELLRLSKAVDEAVKRDPATAHRVLIEDARREIMIGTRRIREVPAFYASSMGDREELVKLMHEAANLGERWYSPSITARIRERWKADAEVIELLSRLHATSPKIEGI